MEKSILIWKRNDRIRNTELGAKTKLMDIMTKIDQRKWRWTGYDGAGQER